MGAASTESSRRSDRVVPATAGTSGRCCNFAGTPGCAGVTGFRRQRLPSSHCWIWLRGAAPTFCAIGWPSLNSSIVGMPRTP